MIKKPICCPGVLEKFVDDILKNDENITFELFKELLLKEGFEVELVGGDENHGTYHFHYIRPDWSVDITKCHCGYIHYLEDMCSNCDPAWYPNWESHQLSVDLSSDLDDLPF